MLFSRHMLGKQRSRLRHATFLGLEKDPFPVNPGELSRSFPREVRQVDIPTSTSLRWWPSLWVPGVVVTFTQGHSAEDD